MKLIKRKKYLNELISVMGTPDIKVITGIRRSGKSKLLEAFATHIEKNIENANIIRVDFNSLEFENLKEYHQLHDYVESRYIKNSQNFVMIDEVQMCEGFELAINSLHACEKYDIYITGSNAFLLSSDLATLFTGRTFSIEVFPFSMNEFATYYNLNNPDEAFERYVIEGGMPGSYVYGNDKSKQSYLCDVVDTLILRDIKQKYNIRNTEQLIRTFNFLLDNIGNISSLRNIASTLSATGLKVTDKTLAAYISHLCNAFAFYEVQRYDISGKKYLTSGAKYYLADQSIRFAKLGKKKINYGRVCESIVAIELIRRGWEIYAGALYKKEIDFVAIKRDKQLYIQVCDDISSEKTFKREITPLLKISDAYPKMIIARTKHEESVYDGVMVVDIARWLLQEQD